MGLENGSNKQPSTAPSATTSTGSTLLHIRGRFIALQPIVLRASAVLATAVAAAVMGLNIQSYTAVVAIIGTKPLMQTFTVKFSDTPAFV